MSVVSMSEDSPYVNLGEVEPVNLISFAFQIASGMVRAPTLPFQSPMLPQCVLRGSSKEIPFVESCSFPV